MNTHELYDIDPPKPTKRSDTPRRQNNQTENKQEHKKIIKDVRSEVFGAWVLHSMVGKATRYMKNMDRASKGKFL